MLYSYFWATKQSLHVFQSPVASPNHGRPSKPAAVEEGPGVRWKNKRRLIAIRRSSLELLGM